MLKNITIGQFFPGNSVVHRADPRTKIVLVTLYIVSIFLVKSFFAYALITIFLFYIISLTKIPIRYILKGIRPIFFIVIFTFVLNVLMGQGEDVLVEFWRITIYKEGLYLGFYFAVRLLLLVIGSQVLTLSTSPLALTDGLEHLLNPFKKIGLPVHELAMMMTIAIRFIPTLLNETDKIMKAQMSRGADFESGNLISRARALVPVMIPLFISAFKRADELALAMESRCYRGGEGRTRLKKLQFTLADIIVVIVFLLMVAAVITLEMLVK